MAFLVALLGAESTGKTTLAHQLGAALRSEGRAVAVVGEYLREFCDRHGRTPLLHEQHAIADEQSRRIAAACDSHEIVVADTTALMVAVYSEQVFDDTSLYAAALAALPRADLVLLTGLDLPWVADGLMRDGPQVRAPVDALLRAALVRSGTDHAVVSGRGEARLATALAAVRHARAVPHPEDAGARVRWQWACERCSDGACERHLLRR